jgi:hypothetical protein
MNKTEQPQHDEAAKQLEEAVEANPWIAEPHVLLSQIYNQKSIEFLLVLVKKQVSGI